MKAILCSVSHLDNNNNNNNQSFFIDSVIMLSLLLLSFAMHDEDKNACNVNKVITSSNILTLTQSTNKLIPMILCRFNHQIMCYYPFEDQFECIYKVPRMSGARKP